MCTYYKLILMPTTLVLDPLTGQKMRAWEGMISAERFLEVGSCYPPSNLIMTIIDAKLIVTCHQLQAYVVFVIAHQRCCTGCAGCSSLQIYDTILRIFIMFQFRIWCHTWTGVQWIGNQLVFLHKNVLESQLQMLWIPLEVGIFSTLWMTITRMNGCTHKEVATAV